MLLGAWISVAIQLAALVWSLRVWRRHRDPRLSLVCLLFAVALGRGIGAAVVAHGAPDGFDVDRLWTLALWLLTLPAIAALDGHLTRQDRARSVSESSLRRIVETSQEGIWTLDREGVTTFVNRRMAGMLGWEPSEMLGRHVLEFVAEEQRREVARALEQQLPHAEAGPREACLLRRDGTTLWARLTANALFDDAGRYDGALAMVEDATRARHDDRTRRARDRALENLAQGAPLGEVLEQLCEWSEMVAPDSRFAVLLLSADGRQLESAAGPALPEPLRESLARLALAPPMGGAGPGAADLTELPAWETSRREAAPGWDFRSGSWTTIWGPTRVPLGVLCRLRREEGASGAEECESLRGPANLAGIAVGARRTQREVERLQATLLAAIEQSPAGIVIADAPSGRVRIANARAVGTTERTPLQVVELPMESLPLGWQTLSADGSHILPEDLPLRIAMRDGRAIRNLELLLRRKDGLKRWYLANAAPIRDASGAVTSGVLVLLDISERKRDERDMTRLLRALGERKAELESIFRATSHDLRAPLVNIDGFARELELACGQLRRILTSASLDSRLEAEIRPLLQVEIPLDLDYIRASARRMEQLLAALRNLIGVDRLELRFQTIDMNELVAEVLRGFEYHVRDGGVRVHVGNLPPCWADRASVVQIVSNLVDNAMKYRDPQRKPEIRVQGRVHRKAALYSVSDNGIGIPEDMRERIFHPFRRHAPAGVGGDGLGLTILSRLLDRMSGSVRVDSEVGVGSRFEIHLPGQAPGTAAPERGERVPQRRSLASFAPDEA